MHPLRANRVLLISFGMMVLSDVLAAAMGGDPIRPDPKLTPGATLAATTAQLCVRGYAGSVRNVSEATKHAVFAEYRIDWSRHSQFEVDHDISLELAGSNDIKNLWPQSYHTMPYNAHVKDVLEDRLHALVCRGDLPLATAQEAIRTDWIAAYQKYVVQYGPLHPAK